MQKVWCSVTLLGGPELSQGIQVPDTHAEAIVCNLLTDCALKCYMYIGLPWWLTGKESNLPRQRTWVQSLGWQDPLEEEMATHSYILSRKTPRTGEPGWGQESDRTL